MQAEERRAARARRGDSEARRPGLDRATLVCLDKAFDITRVYRLLTGAGFTPHVRGIGEDTTARRRGARARRCVVRAHTPSAQPLPRAARALGRANGR